jgi:2-polyprenyl-3-methyl-5-hydroxy-6-metoxy-1,4-benzoquinol methylase
MDRTIYESGEYLTANPTWGEEDSPWKAQHVAAILKEFGLNPATLAEVGCGVGGILENLAPSFPAAQLSGYDISPQAIRIAREKRSADIRFFNFDIAESGGHFDVLLALDVIEHVEDPWSFARKLRPLAEHKVYHIPLDFNALAAARGWPIMDARRSVGHLNYFTKDTAIALLHECGYDVLATRYTATAVETPGASSSAQARVLNVVRRALSKARPDLCARLLGGYSLLVLAR